MRNGDDEFFDLSFLKRNRPSCLVDGINFIQDLATVLLAAGLAGALCKRIGLSVIVGYLLAGILIGPHTPPFSLIHDVARIETLSQVGLVFLMFAIGLGLSLTKFRRLGLTAVIGTGLGAFFVLNLTKLLGLAVGWTSTQSLFVAAMFMVSSSAVIAKIIQDLNLGHERFAQVALGVTVLEDVVAVIMLAVLGAQTAPAGGGTSGVGGMLASLSAFVVALVMIALFFVPRLLRRLEARADPELQTIVVAGVLFLMAWLAVKAGYSPALGAFLLGAIVAEMPQRSGLEKAFTGMRDMFSSVFFVAIGMMIEVSLVLRVWPWILGLCAFTLLARFLAVTLAMVGVGLPFREAARTGLTVTPLGEFTFLIAQLGVTARVLPKEFYPVAVGVSILTVLISPLINRRAEPVVSWLERNEPSWLRRAVGAYHSWIGQFSVVQGSLWWRLTKGRWMQIALEMLFITGLLIFSELLYSAYAGSGLAGAVSPTTAKLIFWSVIGLLVLVPLVAIWRNISALSLIFAELATQRTRASAKVVERSLKIVGVLGLAYWLSFTLPVEALSRWAWLVIIVILGAVLAGFSRRIVYWHSEWQTSLSGVFDRAGQDRSQEPLAPAWAENSGDWNINVQECVLPERAACSGKTIAELGVRARFGSSITEINRQGFTLVTPEPNQPLYSGDRLLLLGTPEQIAATRKALTEVTPPGETTSFDEARLEAVRVPAGKRTGSSLAQMQIQRRTGVLVAGHGRDGQRTINPAPTEVLRPGDEVLVLGAPSQIRAFKRWLEVDEENLPESRGI